MKEIDAAAHDGKKDEESDLARRLARYRRRVAAEGRSRSLRLIDRAIDEAGKEANGAA